MDFGSPDWSQVPFGKQIKEGENGLGMKTTENKEM